MNYYIELTLLSNTDIPQPLLWSKVFTQLHLALVEKQDVNQQVPIGVNFVDYRVETVKGKRFSLLGDKLRIFAEEAATLQGLNLDHSLERLIDYVHIKSIKPTPTETGFVTVSRCRSKPPSDKKNAAYALRRGLSPEAALAHFWNHTPLSTTLPLPFIKLKSLSSGHDFSLTIQQKEAFQAHQGRFSTYGLSRTSTVPHW